MNDSDQLNPEAYQHREEIDSRNASRFNDMVQQLKEMSETETRLKEMSKKKRKEKIKQHVSAFREDFDESVYLVDLPNRASNRLESLSNSFEIDKELTLEKIITVSLFNTDKTRPLFVRDLYLNNIITEDDAKSEIGEAAVNELDLGREKDLDVSL